MWSRACFISTQPERVLIIVISRTNSSFVNDKCEFRRSLTEFRFKKTIVSKQRYQKQKPQAIIQSTPVAAVGDVLRGQIIVCVPHQFPIIAYQR